jgi:peroxiredoxin 2/4
MKAKLIFLITFFAFSGILNAQTDKKSSIPLIGSKAPSFTFETTNGTLKFPEDFGDKWKIIFSHPKAFTPVCTHEILHLALLQDELKELGVEVAILSTDTKENHEQWRISMEEILSKRAVPVKIEIPFVSDPQARIARLYGMLHEEASDTRTVRGVFIISPDNIIESISFYPLSVGRSLEEMIRTVQALKTVRESKLFTPANWEPYNDLLVPYYPYSEKEMIDNPELLNEYYKIGSYLWYKKSSN